MKHAYLLLMLTAGILATGCKKEENKNPDPRLNGRWAQDGSLILLREGSKLYSLTINGDMSYSLDGGYPPALVRGSFTVQRTGNRDSSVLELTPSGGGTITYPVLFRSPDHIAVKGLGVFVRQ